MTNRKRDHLLVLVLLLAAGLLFLVLRPQAPGGWVRVTVEGQEVGRYPLDQDRTVTIGREDYNILEIAGGRAAIVEANCKNQNCVRSGAISRTGETIVCLPHKVLVEIVEGAASDFDALSQ